MIEKLPSYNSGLYYTFIHPVQSHVTINKRSVDPANFIIWHDRLGHPGSTMMRRIIENSTGHPLKDIIVPLSKDKTISCENCNRMPKIFRANSRRYMWTYYSIEWAISVLYGIDRCIDTLVTCESIIHS